MGLCHENEEAQKNFEGRNELGLRNCLFYIDANKRSDMPITGGYRDGVKSLGTPLSPWRVATQTTSL